MHIVFRISLVLSLTSLGAACGESRLHDGAPPREAESEVPALMGLEEGLDVTLEHYVPAPNTFAISAIRHRGSGCPKDTATINISADKQAFTMIFDAFTVSLDADDRRRRVNAHCFLDLEFSAPKGWSFGILDVETRGFVDLDKGVRATQRLSAFTRRGYRTVQSKSFKGEMMDDYLLATEVPTRSTLWTSCRGKKKRMILHSALALEGRRGKGGLISVDSIDGEVAQNYRIGWRRCT